MNRDELFKLAGKYQIKADNAYENYQATGITRYDRERRNAEDLAEALRAAANAAEEHSMLGSVKGEFLWAAMNAEAALQSGDQEKMAEVLRDLVSFASTVLGYKRREVLK